MDKQFAPERARRVRALIDRLATINFPDGASWYYAAEARRTLEAGTLLAALVIVSALLEVTVRALQCRHTQQGVRGQLPLQELLERDRSVGFAEIIDELVAAGFFVDDDGFVAKKFYHEIRIPVQHGLSARFVRKHHDESSWWARDFVRQGAPIDAHELEDIVEQHGLDHLDAVIGVLERNGDMPRQ